MAPYKFLRGNTSGSTINSTRVVSNFVIKHPLNYKNEFFRDLGAVDVRYRRRRRARFARTLFGSVRKRWFLWRNPSSFWPFRKSMLGY